MPFGGYVPTAKSYEEAVENIRRLVHGPSRQVEAMDKLLRAVRDAFVALHHAEIASREAHVSRLMEEIESHKAELAKLEAAINA